jgi:hypothetical protein
LRLIIISNDKFLTHSLWAEGRCSFAGTILVWLCLCKDVHRVLFMSSLKHLS